MESKIEVTLFNTPRIIGDYIIKNKKKCSDKVDVLLYIMALSEKYIFAFRSDMFNLVCDNTLKYIKFKRKYIIDCVDIVEQRTEPARYTAPEAINCLKKIQALVSAPFSPPKGKVQVITQPKR